MNEFLEKMMKQDSNMNQLPDWISWVSSYTGIPIDITSFSIALIASIIASVFISMLYKVFYVKKTTGSQINRSFLLMGVSITTLFFAIQFQFLHD